MKSLKTILDESFTPDARKIKELVIRLNAGEDIKKSVVEQMFKTTKLEDLKSIWALVGKEVNLVQGVTGSTRKS